MSDEEIVVTEAEKKDSRIVYGAQCTWWDEISEVDSSDGDGVPVCPHCGGVLFERASLEEWQKPIDVHEKTHLGYANFMAWLKGKCFPTIDLAKEAYAGDTDIPTDF